MGEVEQKASLLQEAFNVTGILDTTTKNNLLRFLSENILKNKEQIILANRQDLQNGQANGLSKALLDRLLLDETRIRAISQAVLEVETLPDPIGEVLCEYQRPNGLQIKKITVPMGVIAMIYEARPNVTVDAFTLAFKAGSAVMLRGGSAALHSNRALVAIVKNSLKQLNLSENLIALIEDPDRDSVKQILTSKKYLDLVIPRGSASLIKMVVENATIPVIETGAGICHVYIDRVADLTKAEQIAFNSKVQRPSVCNAAETLLLHQDIATDFLPRITAIYQQAGVTVVGDEQSQKICPQIGLATEKDWASEYLDLKISIKIVQDLAEAVSHIRQYGTKHTDAIVSEDQVAINQFINGVDSSTVMVNTSTRFTDGGEFGFGCEIGISTQKLHARGPMGLKEITTYKYIVNSNGLIRN